MFLEEVQKEAHCWPQRGSFLEGIQGSGAPLQSECPTGRGFKVNLSITKMHFPLLFINGAF